jgi:anti-sigma regulatory factor (Ser/Thr protein kinase)
LLLYTDGLVEKRGEPIDVGLARLQAAARQAVAGTDASFADEVYRALLQEASLDDDIALLAIESLPLGRKLELTLDAHPSVLAGLRSTIGRWLGALNASEDEQFDVALSASEAASNAIEHAYGASRASFTVLCECESGEVRIIVSDQGRWRRSRPYGRGRGLMIMRALMDAVKVARTEQGTTVTMTKKLEAGS